MPTEPSKYAQNQFDTATVGRLPLMGELLANVSPRIAAAAAENPTFDDVHDLITEIVSDWNAGETVLANAEAGQLSATLAFEEKMASLTRKPNADTNSPLEAWDAAIRNAVAYQGTTYKLLLPHGRETLTDGSLEQQLDALRDFGVRLSQTAVPVLVALGTTVTTFANAARTLRESQGARIVAVENASDSQENLRVAAAEALYGMVGFATWKWRTTPLRVDSLFDVNLLRGSVQVVPAAPADTLWTPADRRLATSALPSGATRLEAWRLGPGGAPERLAVGDIDTAVVIIPADITFDHGKLYQLWLTARNSRGTSPASPMQNWTAP